MIIMQLHLRHNIWSVEAASSEAAASSGSRCEILVGIEWVKRSKFQKRIARNICEKLAHRAKEVLEAAAREIAPALSG